jgi:predicted N-acetyltransferase YhbS
MNDDNIKIRLMRADDFEAVVQLDEKILKVSRRAAYKLKFEKVVESKDYVLTSFVAEDKDGKVVGFIMGELYIGQYGDSQERATLNPFGVDPDYRRMGIGKRLLNEFMEHLKSLGVHRILTLVRWNDSKLIQFYSKYLFKPSETINLERSI